MKKLIKEIQNKKNLEVNLPQYATGLMSLYHRFAMIHFTMNYYNYYEVISESQNKKNEKIRKLLSELNEIIGNVMLQGVVGKDLEQAVQKIESIRDYIVRTMQVYTSYLDAFNIYEYVLNRVEYQFKKEEKILDGYQDEEFTKIIMRYILDTDDKALINMKICDVIRQLPVRMTKNHFFELVENGLSLYNGSPKGSLEDFLYMIRTSAMLDFPEEDAKQFEDLYSIYQEFRKLDYESVTEEVYETMHDKINYVSDEISQSVDMYVMLTELVNDVYAILLAMPYAMRETKEEDICVSVIQAVNGKFGKESLDPLGEEVCDMLIALEGKQEKIYEQYSSYEFVLDEIKTDSEQILQSLMLDKVYHSLYRISDLLSGNGLFMEFDENPEKLEIADKPYIEEKKNKFCNDLTELFEKNTRKVNRAVMAAVLASLPVFFENVTQLQDYVYQSLLNCKDVSEKKAVVEVLRQMISEDEFNK